MLFVIRYSLYGELQPITFPNLELGTLNLERRTAVLCPLSLRVVGSYGRSVNSLIGQLLIRRNRKNRRMRRNHRNGKHYMTLSVIRYTEKLNLYLVLTLNLEPGTWNLEL